MFWQIDQGRLPPDELLKEAQVIKAILKLNIDRCRWVAA
jgi:hypothetical protein